MATGRTIAIGDIHGCANALKTLLTAVEPTANDTLVILGDVIDRGPDSCNVLQQLIALQGHCQLVPILGNHEQMLLDAVERKIPLQDWLMHGGSETLDSYGPNAAPSAVPAEHLDFLYTWEDYYETIEHFFAHGNYMPKRKLHKQPWEVMRWRSLKHHMPTPHKSGKTAILGHTANKLGQIVDHGHIICIDTYCHGGGWLTAMEPKTGMVWQSNEAGELQQSKMLPVA